MIRRIAAALLPAVLLAQPAAAQEAAPPPASQQAPAPAFDAAAAWREFLARKDAVRAFDSYAVLDKVGYDLHAVQADACREQRRALDEAVRLAGISIALRHAALLCAEATGDAAGAAREGAAFDALSRLALSQASEIGSALPIRVLGTQDAYALIAAAGLESLYDYYVGLLPARYMPFVIAAWDEDSGSERHLTFDSVDAMNAVIHDDPYSGYPFQRTQLVLAIIEEQSRNDSLMGMDMAAVRASLELDAPQDKVARLRDAAAGGGVQASATWMTLCENAPYPGCADGLVDALLPAAEQRRAVSMVLLAYAYAQGLGIERDEAAARTLLDAADRRWAHGAASAYFAAYWLARHQGEAPALVQARIESARRAGNPNIDDLLLYRDVNAGKSALDAAAIAHLSRPAVNQRGAGLALLASHFQRSGDQAAADSWLRRAAEAGDADAQATLGARLLEGEGVARDPEAARAMLADAAHGGSAVAGRMLAYQAGKRGDWQQAMSWLLAPMAAGDFGAILDAGQIYELERPGFSGQEAKAVEFYTMLAALDGGAEARRRLATMAAQGRGMPKAPARAEQWLRQDADEGDAQSQVLLGIGYLRGEFGQVDEARGRQWMDKAMQAGEADAFSSYGLWLINTRDTPESRREGLAVLQRGVDQTEAAGDGGGRLALNNLAWALCTSRRDDVRDPPRGLAVGQRMGAPEDLDPSYRDTFAACLAATGDYAEATRLQTGAVDEFQKYADAGGERMQREMDQTLKRARARLALYQARKPYIEHDPE